MFSPDTKHRRTIIILLLIAFFSLFALWIRLIPMLNLGTTDILNVVGSDDPLYNLRQVEQVLHNFPRYAWFDAMTHFPEGDFIYWGPLFTYLLAVACMAAGAASRPEIIGVALLVPPVLATILVPVMYYVGKACGDWKTGLIASGFVAIVSGQYFYRSFYGYLDHHIAEVFFATIFCLAYILALKAAKETNPVFRSPETLRVPCIYAVLAGIAYILGLFTMPTMILFAMIVAIFTVIQAVIDFTRGDGCEYLVLINTIIFGLAIAGLFVFGIKSPDQLSLAVYSYGHVYAYLALIVGTVFLYVLSILLKGRSTYLYPLLLAGTGICVSLVLFLASPAIFNLLISSFFAFFGQAAEVLTVQEARGWDLAFAWTTFNYGLVLMVAGAVVLAYRNVKEEHPHQVFALVWSAVMLASTWQHIRYEYYLAINVALLSAVAVSFAIDIGWQDISRSLLGRSAPVASRGQPEPADAAGKRAAKRSKKERVKEREGGAQDNLIPAAVLLAGCILALLFVVTSVNYSYTNAAASPIRMNQDWRESLEWLGKNTPDTGVDYYAIDEQKTFRYPASAYGVMSWWDYGHMITYIAKRIPNANPFQRGVAGDVGAAAFFMTTSEDTATSMADQLGTKYIITDIEMDMPNGKFPAMSVWFNTTVQSTLYQTLFAIADPSRPSSYQEVLLNNQTYYLTMVSRLHNFDGSMTAPQQVYYLEYLDPSVSGLNMPVITNAEAMNATGARTRASGYNLKAPAGYHATVMNPGVAIHTPVDTVPALRHFRLVHESPTNIFNAATPDIKYVKVFEYVKGARIMGDGVIEVPVITNTNRTFTYRQASVNGEFIVPYATSGSQYDVRATGKYQIMGTARQIDVPEEAVLQGLVIR